MALKRLDGLGILREDRGPKWMGELAVAEEEELWLIAVVVATASVVEGGGGAYPGATELLEEVDKPC